MTEFVVTVNHNFHFPSPGITALFQQLFDQGKDIMTGIADLALKMDALAASNNELVLANAALQGDVTQSLGLINDIAIAAVVLKDAYDVLKNAVVAGGTPAQIAALIAQADAVIAGQADALAKATASKAALDAQDAALAALPGTLTP